MPNQQDHELPQELLELEQRLVELVPTAVCSELHMKWEESMIAHVASDEYMESYHETHSHELQALEVHLKDIAPVSMPSDMLDRMADAMDQWSDDPIEQNVIGFDDYARRQSSKPGLFGIGFLSAAAAVALLAGVAALVVSDFGSNGVPELVAQNSLATPSSSSFANQSSNISGISAPSIGLGDASGGTPTAEVLTSKVMSSKEKIIYDKAENPYRFVEVEYMDEVKVKSPCGRDVILSRPRKDGYVIPIKVH
ncbi:MAG: hypothetical protein P8P36_10580 [Akkermansiaceae bacterium]|nr:hypothetical protein [Akkermansiaceae bacterium]